MTSRKISTKDVATENPLIAIARDKIATAEDHRDEFGRCVWTVTLKDQPAANGGDPIPGDVVTYRHGVGRNRLVPEIEVRINGTVFVSTKCRDLTTKIAKSFAAMIDMLATFTTQQGFARYDEAQRECVAKARTIFTHL